MTSATPKIIRTYMITNTVSGTDLGLYEATSAREAIDVMARAAGYADHVDACRVACVEPGELAVWSVEADYGVLRATFGSGGGEVVMDDADVPRVVWDGLGCDWPVREDHETCKGHPAGPMDPMGETVYCDGSCR